jgi:glycosyltransferase involved in cell wall biosynthesis
MKVADSEASPLFIVMPVLDEGAALTEALAALQPIRQRGARLIVVDAGSSDDSAALAGQWADKVLQAPRGRAAQMHAGTLAALGWAESADLAGTVTSTGSTASPADPILIFLHADTRLPSRGDEFVRSALADGRHAWGRFDVRIDAAGWRFRMVEKLMNLRSRLTGIATGDQALFVRASAYLAAGGFPDIALMEDIALSRRLLRAAGRPQCLRARVLTSARRWLQHGFWRTVLLMWQLRAAYFCGVAPERLARRYGYRPRV